MEVWLLLPIVVDLLKCTLSTCRTLNLLGSASLLHFSTYQQLIVEETPVGNQAQSKSDEATCKTCSVNKTVLIISWWALGYLFIYFSLYTGLAYFYYFSSFFLF